MVQRKHHAKLAVLAAAAGCLLAGGIATAGGQRISTRVLAGWDGNNHYVDGFLSTKRTPDGYECLLGREIVVRYVKTGKRVGSGRTRTRGKNPGSFRIGLGGFAPQGTYRVIAKRKKVGSIICERGSDTLEQPFAQND